MRTKIREKALELSQKEETNVISKRKKTMDVEIKEAEVSPHKSTTENTVVK